MNSRELWMDIREFPKYSVSNKGQIQNNLTGKVLRPQRKGSGLPYLGVSLSVNGIVYQRLIHRLVVSEFIDDIPSEMTVNHIDGNKWNNDVDNLEIVSYSENNRHSFATGLKKPTNAIKSIRCVETGEEFISINSAAEALGVWATEISAVLHGRRRSTRGLTFELVK